MWSWSGIFDVNNTIQILNSLQRICKSRCNELQIRYNDLKIRCNELKKNQKHLSYIGHRKFAPINAQSASLRSLVAAESKAAEISGRKLLRPKPLESVPQFFLTHNFFCPSPLPFK